MEYAVLSEFADHYFRRGAMDHIDVIVYLRVEPEICLQRIRKRARKEELGLTLVSNTKNTNV